PAGRGPRDPRQAGRRRQDPRRRPRHRRAHHGRRRMIDIPGGVAAVLVALIVIVPTTASALLAVTVRRVGRDAEAARKELKSNSGSSTRDAVDRIEAKLTTDYHRISGLERLLEDHIDQSVTIIQLL